MKLMSEPRTVVLKPVTAASWPTLICPATARRAARPTRAAANRPPVSSARPSNHASAERDLTAADRVRRLAVA